MSICNYIFIDGSYYCFHRYYSLLKWWKHANPNEEIDDPTTNDIFIEKFKKTFVDNIKSMPKKLKINKTNYKIIVGKDCKRANIWRHEYYDKYKSTRENNENIGTFFKIVYEEQLFEKAGCEIILYHNKLEADDCIALYVKYLVSVNNKTNIYIITSDKDYLQLNNNNINLLNLSFKNIVNDKCMGDAISDLQLKILMGDISDNIPSVFPKCGLKTAIKCIDDEDFFKKKMNNNVEYYKQYECNKILIDFNNIPTELVTEFNNAYLTEYIK